MQFIKKLLAIAVFACLFCQFSIAKENEFRTDKLWKKFTKNDLETLQNINSALAKNNFDEAVNLIKILKDNHGNEKNSLADAIFDIVLWKPRRAERRSAHPAGRRSRRRRGSSPGSRGRCRTRAGAAARP